MVGNPKSQHLYGMLYNLSWSNSIDRSEQWKKNYLQGVEYRETIALYLKRKWVTIKKRQLPEITLN